MDLRQLWSRRSHQPRSGAAHVDRAGPERLFAEHRGAGHERAGDQRSEPALFGDRGSRHCVARDQPSGAQLPLARQRDPAAGRGGPAGSARALCNDDRCERETADRRYSISEREACRPAAADEGPDCVRPRPRDYRGRGRDGIEGSSAFLLGAVLERHFARYVSTVTEMVLRSQSRGEINRWTPNWGTRPTL
jgi:hypothetical protein